MKSDWTQYRFDAGNTSWNPYENTITPSTVAGLTQRWDVDAVELGLVANGFAYTHEANRVDAVRSPTTGAALRRTVSAFLISGRYRITYDGSALTAVDVYSDAVRWRRPLDSGVTEVSTTVVGGAVYQLIGGRSLAKIEASSGRVIWSVPAAAHGHHLVADATGVYYVSGERQIGRSDDTPLMIHGLSATTGSERWLQPYSTFDDGPPILADGGVYFIDNDSVVARATATGANAGPRPSMSTGSPTPTAGCSSTDWTTPARTPPLWTHGPARRSGPIPTATEPWRPAAWSTPRRSVASPSSTSAPGQACGSSTWVRAPTLGARDRQRVALRGLQRLGARPADAAPVGRTGVRAAERTAVVPGPRRHGQHGDLRSGLAGRGRTRTTTAVPTTTPRRPAPPRRSPSPARRSATGSPPPPTTASPASASTAAPRHESTSTPPPGSDGITSSTSPRLASGRHTVRIRATGDRNPAAQARVITIDRIELGRN